MGPRHVIGYGEIDSLENLILLCPTHHTLIDKSEADYSIEFLEEMKAEHERHVRKVLSQGGPQAVTNLPFAAADFVGRDREIVAMSSLLKSHGMVSLVGLPGIGKTTLALEVGSRMERSDGVTWLVRAHNDLTLESDLRGLALRLGLSESMFSMDALTERLAKAVECTVIIDGLSDWSVLGPLRAVSSLSLIVTTQDRRLCDPATVIELDVFDHPTTASYLKDGVADYSEHEERSLMTVVDLVGGHPLAVAVARSILMGTHCSVDELATKLRDGVESVEVQSPRETLSLGAVFGIALDRLAIAVPASHALLQMLACFAKAPVRLDWLADEDLSAADDSGSGPFDMADLDELVALSLVQRSSRDVQLHPVLHGLLQRSAVQIERQRGLLAVATFLVENEPLSMRSPERTIRSALAWLPHALHLADELDHDKKLRLYLQNDAGMLLTDIGAFDLATDVLGRSVLWYGQTTTESASDRHAALLQLAAAAGHASRLLESSLALGDVLARLARLQNHDWLDVANLVGAIDQQACLLASLGAPQNAIQVYEPIEAISGRVTIESRAWPSLAIALGNYGAALVTAGDSRARSTLEDALAAKDSHWFPRPSVEFVRTLYWLVAACTRSDDHQGARFYLERLRSEVDGLEAEKSIYGSLLRGAEMLIERDDWEVGLVDPARDNSARFLQPYTAMGDVEFRFAIPILQRHEVPDLLAEAPALAAVWSADGDYTTYWRAYIERRASHVKLLWGASAVRLMPVEGESFLAACARTGAVPTPRLLELAVSLPGAVSTAADWPPRRNHPCPCGLSRKYKNCCGSL